MKQGKMAIDIEKVRKGLREEEKKVEEYEKKKHNLVERKLDDIKSGKFDQRKFDRELDDIEVKIREHKIRVNEFRTVLTTPGALEGASKGSGSSGDIWLGDNAETESISGNQRTVLQKSEKEEKTRAMFLAGLLGGVLKRYSRPAAIGAFGTIFIILVVVVGGYVAAAYYTNIQLPFGTQIRTSTNTAFTQVSSTIGYGVCLIQHLDLVFAVTSVGSESLGKVCGKVSTIDSYREVVTFSGSVPVIASLDIPIVSTFTATLADEKFTVSNLKVTPVVLTTKDGSKSVLKDEDCSTATAVQEEDVSSEELETSLCYQNFDSKPLCFEEGCQLNSGRTEYEINYVWDFVEPDNWNDRFAGSDTTRIFPKFDVQYDFVTDTPSKTIVVSKNEGELAPPVSGERVGPVNVEIEFSRDVFTESLYPVGQNEKLETFMKIVVKNNGNGVASNIVLDITPIYDTDLGQIDVTSCAGSETTQSISSGSGIRIDELANTRIFDKRSISTGCFILLPRPTEDSHAIVFAPRIQYTYSHKNSDELAIEPVPPSTVVDLRAFTGSAN